MTVGSRFMSFALPDPDPDIPERIDCKVAFPASDCCGDVLLILPPGGCMLMVFVLRRDIISDTSVDGPRISGLLDFGSCICCIGVGIAVAPGRTGGGGATGPFVAMGGGGGRCCA